MFRLSKIILLISALCIGICLASCRERKSDDPIETYQFWAGERPPKDVEVIHGRYWQSGHWSKEYVMYVELKAPPAWRMQFIKQNNLIETAKIFVLPSDAPEWVRPGNGFRTLVPAAADQGSVYYEDPSTGRMFIYEVQL